MELEKLNDKVQKIQEDLAKVKETVLSEAKRKEKIEEIKRRAEETKKELEKNINTLKDKAKDEAKTILNSLNEIINFKLSIWDAASWNPSWGTVSSNWNVEKWFFDKAKDWIWDQWSNIWDEKKWKEEWWKNALRTAWFVVTWVWAVALVCKWVKSLWNRAFWKDKDEDKEKSDKKDDDKKKEKKWFWNKWYWKAIKYSVIWTWIYYVVHWIKTGKWNLSDFSNWDANNPKPENPEKPKISVEEKAQLLYWLENESKWLKEWAERCLKLSQTQIVDHAKNKEEYNRILKRALEVKGESQTIFDEISSSDATDEVKNQAEILKNNIDNYIKEIEAMKEEIYKHVPEDDNNWGENNWWWDNWEWDNNWEWKEDWKENWEDESIEYKPVSAAVVTQATMDFLDKNVKQLSLDEKTKNKLKENMNKYFEAYPILKKDKDNNMKFQIENKAEFSKMVKQSWNDILDWLPWYKSNPLKAALKVVTKGGLDNIDETVKNLNVKYYENIIFKYVWWVVKDVAKREKWNIKLQDFYESISKTYTNKNASTVAKDLAASWQADKDMNEYKYPFA